MDLESIKAKWFAGGQIDSKDVEWLIEQAEMLQGLKEVYQDENLPLSRVIVRLHRYFHKE